MSTYILAAALFFSLTLTLYLLISLFLSGNQIRSRLLKSKSLKFDKLISGTLSKNKGFMEKKGLIFILEKRLSEASVDLKISSFIRFLLLIALLLPTLTFLLTHSLAGSVLTVLAVPVIVYLTLQYLKQRKIKLFLSQLPEIVHFIASSLKSGYSLTQSLNMVAEETRPPASTEFGRVLRDINLGKTYEEAFGKMMERNPIEDLEIMTTAILISKDTGGNLSYILGSVYETLREREKINGEIKSLTAQGRLSGIILSLLPFVVFGLLFFINPGYIKPLFSSSLGRALIIGGICSQITGALVIRKIIKIDW